MSEYPKMERCIICRTELLWKEYKETHEADGFEVTLAVNFLTMLLSRFDGMYEEYAIEPPYAQLATELKKYAKITYYPEDGGQTTEFQLCDKKLIHYLRNGFDHIHIRDSKNDGYISKLHIKSRKNLCSYEYEFDASNLCNFLETIMNILLKSLNRGDYYCQNCKYNKKDADYVNPDC